MKKRVTVKICGRQEFLSNVYESKEEAKENASMGHNPIFIALKDSMNPKQNQEPVIQEGEETGWMNYCRYGFQEDTVRNNKNAH
jgi:hypothetical protein